MIEYTVRVHVDGSKEWFLNGVLHREDGPALEHPSGTKEWFLNDKRHREDGPAIVHYDGTKAWFVNDKRHREDGPAVVCFDGYKEWWLNGKVLTEEQFNEKMNPTAKEMTVEEISKLLGHEVKIVKV
jgi:hypothetical protein